MNHYCPTYVKKLLIHTLPLLIFSTFLFNQNLLAQSKAIFTKGTIVDIKIEGLLLIEKGLIYTTITSQRLSKLSPKTVSEDIKAIYKLGYFEDVSVYIKIIDSDLAELIFKVVEKPQIGLIEIQGNKLFDNTTLTEKLKVFKNNMVNHSRISADVNTILEEYRKKGYMQTKVDYLIEKIDDATVSLTFKITESPRVYLTNINISGTKAYPPLDIERLLMSAEIDCFSWMNESGVFQESKINQDLQIITQHYLTNGYIKVKIDKPDVTLVQNRDYSKVIVNLNISEGDQYYTGKINFLATDKHELLFDPDELQSDMTLQPGEIFNPFKQNQDRFKINDVYLERGYAYSQIYARPNINDDSKTVDITYYLTKGEKAYIGRVEIYGNYETMDSVVRRELEIHDNELFNGLKLRESQQAITRLGFFAPTTGVQVVRKLGEDENTLNYEIKLEEAQTGTFNASLTYSGYSGFAMVLSVSKKNFLGTGETITLSTEQQEEGDSRYDFSWVIPYWLGTDLTSNFRVFSVFESETFYNTRSSGFNLGLSYPIWKNWTLYSTYSWRNEDYTDISPIIGFESLDGVSANSYRSIRLGSNYSTVDHPMFPSKGYEASLFTDINGGPILGGTIEFSSYTLNARYFKTLNDNGTLVFGAKFNWSELQQTNPDQNIPLHQRYRIGGVTSVRGFNWYDIEGPSSDSELPSDFSIEELYPYQGDYESCQADPICPTLPTEKDSNRSYFEQHSGGVRKNVINLQLYFPITREGKNMRGLVFFDMGNVWAEDRMYEITGLEKDPFYYRKSIGTGINLITPMGVLRFEYGIKLDKKPTESPSKFDFHISGLF